MAELSADAVLRIWGPATTERFHCDSSGAQTIYKGAPIVIDASADTLYAHTQSGLTLVDGDVFLGIAAEKHVTASGDSETNEASLVEAYVAPTIVGFKSAVFTNADLGKTVYMSDTGTLSASNGAYSLIGTLTRVEDGFAYVRLTSPGVLNVP